MVVVMQEGDFSLTLDILLLLLAIQATLPCSLHNHLELEEE